SRQVRIPHGVGVEIDSRERGERVGAAGQIQRGGRGRVPQIIVDEGARQGGGSGLLHIVAGGTESCVQDVVAEKAPRAGGATIEQAQGHAGGAGAGRIPHRQEVVAVEIDLVVAGSDGDTHGPAVGGGRGRAAYASNHVVLQARERIVGVHAHAFAGAGTAGID